MLVCGTISFARQGATLLATLAFAALPGAPLAAQVLQARLPDETQLSRAGLVRQWFTVASLDPLRDQVGAATLIGDRLYVQTTGGALQALDAESGRRIWVAQVGSPEPETFAVAANSSALFVVNSTDLFMLDKETGNQLWHTELQNTPSASPAATDTELFVPTFRGQLDVYDIAERRISWYYATGSPILSQPLVTLDNVAFANAKGNLYVAYRDRRALNFRYQTDAPVAAPLGKIGEEWILLASEDYNLYCLRVTNGQTRWRFAAEGPILRAPTPIGSEVYVIAEGKGMFEIDANTGLERWHNPHPARFVSAGPTKIYTRDRLGSLVILDRETGRLRGAVDASRFDVPVRNVENDRIYLASSRGLIVCLREVELDRPLAVGPSTPGESSRAEGSDAAPQPQPAEEPDSTPQPQPGTDSDSAPQPRPAPEP